MISENNHKTSNLPLALKLRKIFWHFSSSLQISLSYNNLTQDPTKTLKSMITNLEKNSICEFIILGQNYKC